MISDDLDTSGMMKCHNKVNQKLTRVNAEKRYAKKAPFHDLNECRLNHLRYSYCRRFVNIQCSIAGNWLLNLISYIGQ